MEPIFDGWPAAGPELLARLAADNTAGFWAEHRAEHEARVRGPMRALARTLEPEFGPVRVFRAQVNRRFRPDAPPYRTDTGGLARSTGGCVLGVTLSATALAVSAGHWAFDGPQARRFRAAAQDDEHLPGLLEGWTVDASRSLTGTPRGFRADHPRIALLRLCGLQVTHSWELGPWLSTAEPLQRVRAAWRAAAPVVAWLDEHVGAADPVPDRPRPPSGG